MKAVFPGKAMTDSTSCGFASHSTVKDCSSWMGRVPHPPSQLWTAPALLCCSPAKIWIKSIFSSDRVWPDQAPQTKLNTKVRNTLFIIFWDLISQTRALLAADLQRRQEPRPSQSFWGGRSCAELSEQACSGILGLRHWKWLCDPLSGADASVENHRLNTLLMTF